MGEIVWIQWAGIDHHGAARTGFVGSGNVTEWMRLHFDAGWRKLAARSDGRVIGRIEKNADGRRTWWVEDAS